MIRLYNIGVRYWAVRLCDQVAMWPSGPPTPQHTTVLLSVATHHIISSLVKNATFIIDNYKKFCSGSLNLLVGR